MSTSIGGRRDRHLGAHVCKIPAKTLQYHDFGVGVMVTVGLVIVGLMVVAAIIGRVCLRALQRFIRTLWPHS